MRRTAKDWAVVAGLIFLAMLAWGCVSYPEWGHGSPGPPEPPPVETPTPEATATPTPEPPPPHPCQECLDQGYSLCNQEPKMLKTGCCNQPPGEACVLIPPVVEQPPVTSPPSTQPHQPPSTQPPALQPKTCEAKLPNKPVKVTERSFIVGPVDCANGACVAKSSCDYDKAIRNQSGMGNGSCFPEELASGVNPQYVAELALLQCIHPPPFGHGELGECFCYNLKSRTLDNGAVVDRGFLGSGDPADATERGLVDAYGRRVRFKNGVPTLVANTANGRVLYEAAYSYPYWGICPPLIEQTCPEEPEPASCRDVGCPPHSGCTEVTPGEWSCVSWDQPTPEPAEGCGVGYIGVEWAQINQRDRCPVPDAANTDLPIAAGKSCVFRLEASSKDRPGGEHIGDRPGCFLAARPRWYQGDCTSGEGGNCVDLGGRDPNQDPDHYGQWKPVGDDGPAWGVHFEINFRTNLWIQACWPDNEAPGHVCSKPVRVIHQ